MVEGIGVIYLLYIPGFLIVEGVYLLRHPWTFRPLAVFVWLGVVGVSLIFASKESTAVLVPFTLGGGFFAYYIVKMWCHERYRLKKRGGRFRRRA